MNGLESTLTPFANMGQSFMTKMLKDTPKHILKGVVEMTEPHVIVAKQVQDVSKQVFAGIAQGEKMAESTAALAEALASMSGGGAPVGCEGGDVPPGFETSLSIPRPPMSMSEAIAWIQGQIDTHFPPELPSSMKPQVSESGIKLEGTLPLLMFLPPLTPFGIIYLLLNRHKV